MVTPRQIAVLLGLCATSVGLYFASQQAEDQPIVVWGTPETATVAQATAAPAEPAAGRSAAGAKAAPVATGGSDRVAAKPAAPVSAVAKAAPPSSGSTAASVAVAAKPDAPGKAQTVQTAANPATTVPPKQAPAGQSKPASAPAAVAAKPASPAVVPAKPAVPAAVAAKPAAAPGVPPAANPRPSAAQVGGSRIPASSPEQIAALAKRSSGRVDPFISLELPAADMSAAPGTPPGSAKAPAPPPISMQTRPPVPKATPLPTPGDGMVVTGIITSARESVAIIAAEGRSRLVQVGDTLPGGIRVVSIQSEGKSVIVSHGGRSARLAVKE